VKTIIRFLPQDMQDAYDGWRRDPIHMSTNLILSFIFGQGLFWKWGSDQISIGGKNPKLEMGLGQAVAEKVYDRIPHTPTMAWTLKAIEIAGDYSKCPIEGATYHKHEITPDIVSCGVTQPAWSRIETVDKIVGAIRDPGWVTSEKGMKLAISCIYGTLFRILQNAVLYVCGGWIRRYIGDPIEAGLHKAVDAVKARN
jgi:hypothetical protein